MWKPEDTKTEQLKSLAHPQWPYSGTAWEWRGFGPRRGFFENLTPEQQKAALEYRGEDAESFALGERLIRAVRNNRRHGNDGPAEQ